MSTCLVKIKINNYLPYMYLVWCCLTLKCELLLEFPLKVTKYDVSTSLKWYFKVTNSDIIMENI